ncbi:MAG: protein kinase [Deltaproteobacteria bacterium]|nr:protein kinase [Deltaproteobacteria bacterium]
MPDLPTGRVLGGRFRILGVLGRGGMSTVYLAQDATRGERVALKVLHDNVGQACADRLRREVQAASRVRHPGALVAYELHEFDGVWVLSLPFHPGRTLAERVAEEGPLPGDEVRRLGVRLAEALAEAHRQGVLHRDVTPNNVMLGGRGEPMLTDFGLARIQDAVATRTTSALGTAGYAAPEVWDGVRTDPRSDLYSLGAVLWFAATGRPPFATDNPLEALKAQTTGRLPLLDRKDLNPDLTAMLKALLDPDPDRRPQGATEVADSLKVRAAPDVLTPGRAPAGEPRPTAEPGQTGSSRQPRHHLAPGQAVVVVTERQDDRPRREVARARHRGRRRRRHRDPGDDVRRLLVHIKEQVFQAFGVPEEISPEAVLTEAVAREAGLPETALVAPPVLWEPRFRLVDGVDPALAARLAEVAKDVGFRARVIQPGRHDPRAFHRALRSLIAAVILFAVGQVLLSGSLAFVVSFGATLLLVGALLTAVNGLVGESALNPSVLPLAFPADLRPLLTPGSESLLPPPLERRTGAEVAPPPAGPAPPPGDLPRVEPSPGTGGSIAARVRARLESLSLAVEDPKSSLPAVVRADVTDTLTRLKVEVDALAAEVEHLEAEQATLEADIDPTQAAAVSARLARLDTLERAGEDVDPAERRRLEAAVRAHEEARATAAALGNRLTAATASLLDIGATAVRARRELLAEPEAPRSAERLTSTLQAQAAALARTRREMA